MPDSVQTVVCYGDSNTWGYDPCVKRRFPYEQRWTTVLQEQLGSQYTVIPEGLCGRTTVLDDPYEGIHKNGKRFLLTCLETHKPLDFLVVMLGTNDLKKKFHTTAWDVAEGARSLIEEVYKSQLLSKPNNHLLLVAPPRIGKLAGTDFEVLFEGAASKSHGMGEVFSHVARDMGCAFLDASLHIEASPADAIHLDRNAHETLGKVIAEKIMGIKE